MNLLNEVKKDIEDFIADKITDFNSVGGGCIADSRIITTESGKKYFLKMNTGFPDDMFPKEANGLNELKKAAAVRVPNVIHFGNNFLLLEYIEEKPKSANFYTDFGQKFAKLHKTKSKQFGFYEDNYIGSTPQPNIPYGIQKENWTEFYFHQRLLYQYKLCEKNGYASPELREYFVLIENKISDILAGSEEEPSLLHGDLWGGNYLSDEKGEVCLIDPAVYYGHREADLAMTKVFGSFNPSFYKSYMESYPLPEGWQHRENIYKLYHVLNHLNLFGRSYYDQAISLMKYYK